ncbi:DNA-3-methyladenine glycosylase [Candidatus Woesearchaeota archaeon]|nr:DNA-3-methyladenine glycosylase [Candidatus Woesearchaeota archaeon]
MKRLSKEFFERDTIKVAKELLGKIIEVNGIQARIVETEAYSSDPASHAFKRTERSALMFDTNAHVYVYLIYGMYHCLNFTTNKVGTAGAVLIRAVEPLEGIEKMKVRRNTQDIHNLCSGPGKLCSALGINKHFNGLKLGKEISVYDDGHKVKINQSSRIGIKDAQELQWRFFIENNKFVSR